MPLEEKCAATAFDILHRRAATSYTAFTQKYIGRVQDLCNRIKRWTTKDDDRLTDTSLDITVTCKTNSGNVAGRLREIKESEEQQALTAFARVIRDQKKYSQTRLKPDIQGVYHLSYNFLDKMFQRGSPTVTK